MRRFVVLVCVLLLAFGCCAPSFSADFVDYPQQYEDNPYAPAPMIFDYPSLLSYYYYPDQAARPDLYVYGGTYWGLTNTSSWEHSEHTGRDYVSWATYRVNYQLYLNDGTESDTPWKMNKVRLQFKSPRTGTQIRVNGFSDNINLAVQGTTDSYTTLTADVYPIDTLFIPQDSNTRFSFWIEFTVMFNPSIDIADIYNLSAEDSPVQPIMDASGFQPRLVSYIPADSMGGSSAAGQQQIDQSINQQTQQQEQQYNDFTNSGNGSIVSDSESAVGGKLGLFDAVFDLGESFLDIWTVSPGPARLVLPAYSLPMGDGTSYKLWDEHAFDFAQLEGWGFGALKTAVNFGSVFVVYSALIRYLYRVFDDIFKRG